MYGRKIDLRRRGIATSTGHTSTGVVATEWVVENYTVDAGLVSGRVITLHYLPISNSESIKLNGLVLVAGLAWDYTLMGKVLVFTSNIILTVSDDVAITYEKLK